ncbi:MAG: sterol desaturase family protein [Deltaproteobacteria bacterium]|jgi:sterol desaturase/sphingolipid hydroxylase (fatty acid hydroxylase superfamily)|nr:sterol desaturase family protein [Deltaproteobacteria bacterium]
MSETEFQIIKSIGFVAALGLAAGAQRLYPHARSGGSWQTNALLWGTNAAILGSVCAGCACTVSLWASDAGYGLFNRAAVPAWLTIPATLVVLDLVSYFWHRANHHISVLWRFHQVHHSDPTFTVTTALRFHPGELLLALPVRLVAVALLGVSIPGVIVFELIFALSNFVEHGDIDLPRWLEAKLERGLVTPALHRRHHSRERELLNSNYGTVFSLWDRALGTYGGNRSQVHVRIGLPGLPASPSVRDALLMPRRVYRGEA